jgi:hypothetical protein
MTDSKAYAYATHLDIKFDALATINVPALVKACTDRWYNQTLCKVNDSVVRLGVMRASITGTSTSTMTSSSSCSTATSSSILTASP